MILDTISLKLKYPTALPDYNKAHQLDAEHVTHELAVSRMKHKHIRKMQQIPEAEQMHYIMLQLTGLTENDLDELDAEDSAALSEIIFGFMRKYAELTSRLMQAK